MTPGSRVAPFLVAVASALAAACDTAHPTYAEVLNDYAAGPGVEDAPRTVVYKVWWSVALFPTPVAPSQASERVRVIPDRAYAYALLAPGWDETSGTPPAQLIPVRTRDELSIQRGDTLEIELASDRILGDCATGDALSQEDADFITQRIFPGDFADVTYDASSCTVAQHEDDASEGE